MTPVSYTEQIEFLEKQAQLFQRLAEINLEAAEKARQAAVEFGLTETAINNFAKEAEKVSKVSKTPTKRPRNDYTLNELILNILDEEKNGLNLPGLLEAVKKSGYKTSSKSGDKGLYQIIYQAVHKMQQSETVVRDNTKRYRMA